MNFHHTTKDGIHYLDNRNKPRWELPLGVLVILGGILWSQTGNAFLSLIIALGIALLLSIFVFLSYIFYTVLEIDVINKKLIKHTMFFGSSMSKRVVTDKFNKANLQINTINFYSRQRHILTYEARTNIDLFVIQKDEDYQLVEQFMEQL